MDGAICRTGNHVRVWSPHWQHLEAKKNKGRLTSKTLLKFKRSEDANTRKQDIGLVDPRQPQKCYRKACKAYWPTIWPCDQFHFLWNPLNCDFPNIDIPERSWNGKAGAIALTDLLKKRRCRKGLIISNTYHSFLIFGRQLHSLFLLSLFFYYDF